MIQLSNEEYSALVTERDALAIKVDARGLALRRAQDLILHIEDVLEGESFDVINPVNWNAVQSDMLVLGITPNDEFASTASKAQCLHQR